jgi:phosphoenolpyruvate carboxylase
MKYPSVDIIKKFGTINNNDTETVFEIITQCIEYIYDGQEIYHAKEQTKDELLQFVNNLTTDQFQKIQRFFETMPKLKYDVNYNCPVCSKEHTVRLEGMDSFF